MSTSTNCSLYDSSSTDSLLLFISTNYPCNEYLSKLQSQYGNSSSSIGVFLSEAGGVADAEAPVSSAGFEIQ